MVGWPVEVKLPGGYDPGTGHIVMADHKLVTPPAIGDLDGDGQPDLAIQSQWTDIIGDGIQPFGVAHLHAYHADGTGVSGFPVNMQGIVEYYGSAQEFITEGTTAPSMADVNGDGSDEVAAGPIFTPTYLYDGSGSEVTTYGSVPAATAAILAVFADPAAVVGGSLPSDVPVTFTTSGAFGKFLPGGRLGYAQPGSGGASIVAALLTPGSGFAIRSTMRGHDAQSGAQAPGFPANLQGLDFLGAPTIADVSGDGQPDIVEGGDSSAMHSFDGLTGEQTAGFPKFTTGWELFGPATGDLDSDGRTDLVATTREGYLFAWDTPGKPSANDEWWSFRHDERNTGRYGLDTRPPGVPRNAVLDAGSGSLAFDAPGDDWYTGTPQRYDLTYQGADGATVRRSVEAKDAAGARVTIGLPPGTGTLTLQAVDDAGNLGGALRVHPSGSVPPAGGGGPRPTACTAGAGFRSVAASPRSRGRRVRLAFARSMRNPVRVDVFQESRGRRVVRERLIARFASRTRSFTWNGRANRRGRRAADGYYAVRYRMQIAGKETDVRRVTLRRTRGRYARRPSFYRRASCDVLRAFKLTRPVFGGPRRTPLGVSYRLRDGARVRLTVLRGKRVIKRYAARTRAAGRTFRVRFAAAGRRRGDYRFKVTVGSGRGATTATLVSRRL
jgi:hypothetical protein